MALNTVNVHNFHANHKTTYIASFPGLPTVLQTIKNWTVGRPEAKNYLSIFLIDFHLGIRQ